MTVRVHAIRARLHERRMNEQQKQLEDIGGEKKTIAFGSQIRSYVLHPYRMVKDHRTGVEERNVDKVLDGDLDGFVKAYLMRKASEAQAAPDKPARKQR